MTKETTDILLEALHKYNPDLSYRISESHWYYKFIPDKIESEYHLSIVPDAPHSADYRIFKSEADLVEYVNLLVGDQPI